MNTRSFIKEMLLLVIFRRFQIVEWEMWKQNLGCDSEPCRVDLTQQLMCYRIICPPHPCPGRWDEWGQELHRSARAGLPQRTAHSRPKPRAVPPPGSEGLRLEWRRRGWVPAGDGDGSTCPRPLLSGLQVALRSLWLHSLPSSHVFVSDSPFLRPLATPDHSLPNALI